MAYTITIEEVLNGITVTPPAANEVLVSTTNYPITISYNAVELPGTPGQGVPVGGTTGQFLRKLSNTNYDTAWQTVADINTTYAISAETVTGGANLRLTGSDASTDDVKIAGGTNVTVTRTDANTITISATDAVGISNVVEDTTPQLGGNLDLNTHSITNAGAEINMDGGNISMFPEGTAGSFELGAAGGTGFTNITSGSGGLNITTPSGSLSIPGTANGDIDLFAPGTGNINLNADTVRVGDSNAAATITTNGTGNLVLNTNAGTNSGNITIAQGVNGAISITPNGTGSITLSGPSVAVTTPTGAGTPPLVVRNTTTTNNSIRWPSITVQKHRSDLTLASMTNEPSVIAYSVRDSASTNRIFASQRAIYQGTGTNPVFAFDTSVDGFTTTVDVLRMSETQARFGNANTAYTVTTNGTGNLVLNTNAGTNSGSITINQGLDANIEIAPNGTGKVKIDNNFWPNTDGAAGYVLQTDGTGVLGWVNGATLGTGVYLTDIVQDTTPQLGGDLDVQGNKITTSQTNGDIKIDAIGTGKVKLNSIAYPNADGANGQVLKTNGSGVLDWADKQDPTIVNDSQPAIQSTGQHWYRPLTGAFYTARSGTWESINDDGFF